jgi:hypothetical protein
VPSHEELRSFFIIVDACSLSISLSDSSSVAESLITSAAISSSVWSWNPGSPLSTSIQSWIFSCVVSVSVATLYRISSFLAYFPYSEKKNISLFSLFWKNRVGLWDHVGVCVSVYPPLVARQRLGKNPHIVARQRIDKNPPFVSRQRLGRNFTAVTNTHAIIEELWARVVIRKISDYFFAELFVHISIRIIRHSD